MSMKKVLFIVFALLCSLTLGMFVVHDYNARALDKLLSSPEEIFNGIFNTSKNINDAISDTFGTKCCKYEDEIYTVKCSTRSKEI